MVMQEQRGIFWCWAAVAVSIDHYIDGASTKTQCDLARAVIDADPNKRGCDRTPRIPCKSLGQQVCDIPEPLQDALGDKVGVGRLRDVLPGSALSFEGIQAEVQLPAPAMPVCVRIGWRGGGGHFVAIDGAMVLNRQRWVHVVDPAASFGDAWWLYSEFVSAYQGRGRRTDTFRVKA